MTGLLRTEDEIRAAGAEAVRGWKLTDRQVDKIVALIGPVASEVRAGQDESTATADAA
ncbi:hypothetical protein ACH5AJ_36670 [Streptomyces rochei]|uniref:hypothetical protein n=1 Tax=Streptomyces rochei TaxID=1928 RepID=UPI0037A83D5C